MSELNQKEVNEQMYLFVKRWLDDLPFEECKKVPVMAIGYCLARLSKQDELLNAQKDRHRLEVHNIGNVDIPEGVSEEHFHLVMNNVVEALQHTDKGESYPYEDTGR